MMLVRQSQNTVLKLLRKGDLGPSQHGVFGLLEATGFAVPELMLALVKHGDGGLIAAIEQDGETVLTVGLRKRFGFYDSWETPLSPSGVPAIAARAATAAVQSFLDRTNAPVLLRQLPTDGKAFALLKEHAMHFHVLSTWQRAGLKTHGLFEDWMQTNFDHKRRKEMKRLRARLAEQGVLVTQRCEQLSELGSYIDDFLRLEAAGWKGGRGTALAQDTAMTAALREGLNALFESRKLRFWRITLDGKAIACLFAFVEAGRATLGKIAHDEAFAKFSPGVMVILDATADFFADAEVHVADANAIPGHPMIDRIWRDRLPMANVMVAGASVSDVKMKIVLLAEQNRLALRNCAKSIYHRLKGVKAS
jgi:CelD/BcsL family acetyltransferase involved in cellulose biosynthesis